MNATSWPEARRVARSAGHPLDPTDVTLPEALGATLAVPLVALSPLPAYDAAAMDGYAVSGPGPWRVTGRVLAGDARPVEPLLPGTAVEIATGALVPAGVDAVLPYERARSRSDRVHGEIETGRHIRRRGDDCPLGEEVLPAGTLVTPTLLGLAASLGHDRLTVHRRPRVGVVVTGAELLSHGLPTPGRVRDAISPMLPGLVDSAGGVITWTTRVTDDKTALVEAMSRPDAEIVVVCGATSVGAADHLRGALEALAAQVRVHGVACRPGHPQLLATLPDGRCVVGLPGNPYAALVAALTLLTPLLGRLAGRAQRRAVTARLVGPVKVLDRDTRLVPVAREGSVVVPVGHDRPGLLWGAAEANALAVVPPGWQGAEVELLALPDADAAAAVAVRPPEPESGPTPPEVAPTGADGPPGGVLRLPARTPLAVATTSEN
ncbi:molybdopterin molybdotransferase [Micromonospora pisi]|uniref:Molybdopterin molybdenumtransferase n=1 Tax=Micromonospora pisi TaxID=589240 RepID=A0A495JDG0_9ACTN|nr:molybdopterin molybdotransferase MoeA [Micromonospora pisi]RKR86099.1 molybdopterin molybdotransferase [Micromonospora pisi]